MLTISESVNNLEAQHKKATHLIFCISLVSTTDCLFYDKEEIPPKTSNADPSSSGGLFGATAAPSGGLFGATAAPSGGLFSALALGGGGDSAAATGLFGQPQGATGGIFGGGGGSSFSFSGIAAAIDSQPTAFKKGLL